MIIKSFDSESAFGYKQITTLFQDFSIADNFGVSAIKDTYKRMFKEYKHQYKELTELVMVLNWKIWEHYETNVEYSKVYGYACNNLKDEELSYFLRTVD